VGRACKRGTADRQIVPAEDATAACAVVFGEQADVAAGLTKAAGVMADVCYHKADREVFVKLAGTVTEGNKLVPTTGGEFIAASAAGQYYAAEAAESGVDGDVIRAIAIPGLVPATS
jgi:hypothetical protein